MLDLITITLVSALKEALLDIDEIEFAALTTILKETSCANDKLPIRRSPAQMSENSTSFILSLLECYVRTKDDVRALLLAGAAIGFAAKAVL